MGGQRTGRASVDQGDAARSGTALLPVLVVVDVAFAFQQTAVIPAIPTVQAALGAGEEWAAWLLSAYLMVATVATPALARLADLHGRRPVLLSALALFFTGSLIASLAPSTAILVIARALQGCGGAVFPLTLSLARQHLPDDQVGRSVALLTGAFGLGSAAGFGCGGALAQFLTWRLVFAVGAVVVAVGGMLAFRTVPRAGGEAKGSYDVGGTVLLGGAAVGLLIALTLGPQTGWVSWPVLLCFVVAAAAATTWVREELHHEDPLVDLALFRARPVLLANLASAGLGWALFGSYLLIPRLVEADPSRTGYGLAAAAAVTGLIMLPGALLQTGTGPLAGLFARRRPPGAVLAAGLLLLGVATAILAFTRQSLLLVVVGSAVLGAGAGLGIQSASAVATRDVAPEVASASAALNSTIRRFGGGLGSQIVTIVLAAAAVGRGSPSRTGFGIAFGLLSALALVGAGAGVVAARSG